MESDFEEETSLVERQPFVNIEVDTTRFFQTEQTFSCKEDVVEWARRVGRMNGVVVVVSRSDLNAQIRRPRIFIGCERGGGYRGKGTGQKRRTSTRKCNCPFTLKAELSDTITGKWSVVVANGYHNHPLVKEFEGHSYVGRLSKEQKQEVERLAKAGVKTKDILNNIKLKDPTNVSTLKTVYNARTSMKIREKEGKTHMQQLFKLLNENAYVCRSRNEATTNIVEDLFWSSSSSIRLAKAFPLVFMLDCTYKTNKYRLPLLQIVGVTSTDMTFSVAFCYMHSEKEDNYTWALNCLKDLFDGRLEPYVMITDRELALMNAIKNVFPTTKNLLCRVHVDKNVLSNCIGEFSQKAKFEEFMKQWSILMHSSTTEEYEANLARMQSAFGDYPKALAYVKESWLLKYKECFVSAWVDRYMHLGNSTTNRVEGSHAKLKKYLSSSVLGFVECFEQINILLAGQLTEIKASLEDSITRVPLRFRKPLFKELVGFVSNSALERIEKELATMGPNGVEAEQCNHSALHSLGLPCKHMLTRYRAEHQCIPLSDVHTFWKKLSITDFHLDQNEEVTIEPEMNVLYTLFEEYSLPQKLELKRKLQELGNAGNTTILEPTPKVNLRGRKNNKRGNQKSRAAEESTKRDPSKYEHVLRAHVFSDDPTESGVHHQHSQVSTTNLTPVETHQSQSTVVKKSPMKKRHSKPKLTVRRTRHANTANWVKLFPEFLQNYITKIEDVPGDGHCGYRVVSSFFGWPATDGWRRARVELAIELQNHSELYDNMLHPLSSSVELLRSVECASENTTKEHWLVMPYMGYVISTCYNIIVVIISDELCLSFFPIRDAPPLQHDGKILVFGYINTSHFVRLELAVDSPIPPVSSLWSTFHQPAANGWQDMYAGRIDHFKGIVAARRNTFATSEVLQVD